MLLDAGDRNDLVNPSLAEQEEDAPRGWSVEGRFSYDGPTATGVLDASLMRFHWIASGGLFQNVDLTPGHYLFRALVRSNSPQIALYAQCRPAEDRARFAPHPLAFTLGAKPAVVGAWNCRNLVPLDRRVTLGVRFDLEVELEQSVPDATEWTLVPWFVGRRSNWGGTIARLKAAARSQNVDLAKAMQDSVYRYSRREATGAGRHVIRIKDAGPRDGRITSQAPADGIKLEIKGPAGATIKIHRIPVLQKKRVGGFRREFELPPSPVWRAVASVNRKTLLYLNGREVLSSSLVAARPSASAQDLQELDLRPYLKPGKNVAAVRPAFDTDANALAQIAVVMASGEVLELNTDLS